MLPAKMTMNKLAIATVAGFLFPALTGCGGGSGSDPTPPPPPPSNSWSLNVGGQEKTITQGQTFELGKLQLCEVVKRGGEWQIAINHMGALQPAGVTGCTTMSGSSTSTTLNVAQLPNGTKSDLATPPLACPLSKTQYTANISVRDVNADVTYKLSNLPANFDFSQSGVMHISALKDDGTGNGVLEVAVGACPN